MVVFLIHAGSIHGDLDSFLRLDLFVFIQESDVNSFHLLDVTLNRTFNGAHDRIRAYIGGFYACTFREGSFLCPDGN